MTNSGRFNGSRHTHVMNVPVIDHVFVADGFQPLNHVRASEAGVSGQKHQWAGTTQISIKLLGESTGSKQWEHKKGFSLTWQETE